MRRILYLCALGCLVGLVLAVMRISEMPSRVGDVLDEVAKDDRAARLDAESLTQPNADMDQAVLQGVVCLVGLAGCMTLARRAPW